MAVHRFSYDVSSWVVELQGSSDLVMEGFHRVSRQPGFIVFDSPVLLHLSSGAGRAESTAGF